MRVLVCFFQNFQCVCLLLLLSNQPVLAASPDFYDSVALSADGKKIAACRRNSSEIRIYDTASGEFISKLVGHSGEVGEILLTADGSRAISTFSDNTVRIWDSAVGKELLCIPLSDRRLSVKEIHGDTSGGQEVLELAKAVGIDDPLLSDDCFHCLSLSGDGKIFAVGAGNRQVKCFSTENGSLRGAINTPMTVMHISLDRNGSSLASSFKSPFFENLSMAVQDVQSGQLKWCLTNDSSGRGSSGKEGFHRGLSPRGSVIGLFFTADYETVLSICTAGGACIEFRDVETGKEKRPAIVFPDDPERVNCFAVAYAPDGNKIAFYDNYNHSIRVYNTVDGSSSRIKVSYFPSVSISLDGKLLALGNHTKDSLEIWDLTNMKLMRRIKW